MKKLLLHPVTLLLFIAGGIFWGLFFPQLNPQFFLPFVNLYFNIIHLVVIPLIVSSIIASVAILIRQKVVGKVFSRFIVCALIFFVVVLATILLLRVGFRDIISVHQEENRSTLLSFDRLVQQVPLNEGLGGSEEGADFVGLVQDIVPRNIFASLMGSNLLSIIFFSVILGCVLGLFKRDISTSLITLFDSLYLAFQKIFHMAILFLPIGLLPVIADFTQKITQNYDILVLSQGMLFIYGGAFLLTIIVALAFTIASRKWSLGQIAAHMLRIIVLSFTGGSSVVALPVILHMHDQQSTGHSTQVRSLASLALVVLNVGAFSFFFSSFLFSSDFIQPPLAFFDYVTGLGRTFFYSVFSNASDFSSILASVPDTIGASLLQGFFQTMLPIIFPFVALFSSMGSMVVLLISVRGKGLVVIDPQKDFLLDLSASTPAASADTEAVPSDETRIDLTSTAALTKQLEAEESQYHKQRRRAEKTQKRRSLDRIVTIPLRLSMGLLVLAMLVLYGGISGILQFEGARLSTYQVVFSLTEEIISRANEAVNGYLKSAENKAESLQYILDNNIIPWRSNVPETLAYFQGFIMEKQENISAVYWGNEDGEFYMRRRMGDGTYSTRTVSLSKNGQQVDNFWVHENPMYDDQFPSLSFDVGDPDRYDPRRRLWYQQIVREEESSWTDVYVFFSERALGLTYSFPIYHEDGSLEAVFGIDVTIEDISVYLSQLHVATSDLGYAFLFDTYSRDLIAVSFPDEERDFSGQLYAENPVTESFDPQRIQIENIPSEIVRKGYVAFSEDMAAGASSISKWWSGIFFSTSLETEHLESGLLSVIRFEYDDQQYLFSLAEFSGFPWLMGIIIPEELFLRYVYENNEIQVILILFIFVIVGIISSIFAGKISKSLGSLAEDMQRVKRLEFVPLSSASFIREVNHMETVLENMKQGLDSFKRYIPSDVVTSLLEMGHRAEIGGERKEVTIFFSDIEDFTRKSEINTPEAILAELKNYFDLVSAIVVQNQGTIDKYIGDAVMAFWGAPRDVKDHAIKACQTAFLCQQQLNNSTGSIYTHTRIGLHTGRVLVGNVGSDNRINYTVLGDSVNLASRLEGLNKRYETSIILSQETHDLVKSHFEMRFLDRVVVKGKEKETTIYELVGLKEGDDFLIKGDPQTVKRFLMLYNEGVRYYCSGEWGKAASFFAKAYKLIPNDYPVRLLYARSYQFYQNPPPPEWSGFVKV